MSEQDNDSTKLEQFFQKAASEADIVFNEDDWKKLEARLDTLPPPLSVPRNVLPKITSAVLIAILFIAGSIYWTNDNAGTIDQGASQHNTNLAAKKDPASETPGPNVQDRSEVGILPQPSEPSLTNDPPLTSSADEDPDSRTTLNDSKKSTKAFDAEGSRKTTSDKLKPESTNTVGSGPMDRARHNSPIASRSVNLITKSQLQADLLRLPTTPVENLEQKAGGQLPGAEEADRLIQEATVEVEEKASDKMTTLASPRLSLLLSLAPDFSTTSMNEYTSPGGAFGAMIHYHIRNSWSISAGIVRSKKKYTGDGEDYQPPAGYWKYYTNGVVPESIDGSCNIVEIPLMVQYTLAATPKSKFLIGAGASSYMMLNESYEYNFEEPNPGAKERWDSKKGSKFFFNMVNFSLGFERQITPGLLIGIEPYLKIPIEEIGWSNLKLFSTGASFTLRYRLLDKNPSLITRSRSPD